MSQDILLFFHVTGATVLLGTGAGIAFFMVMSNRSRDPALIAHVAGIVVIADFLFTATAAVAQPVTGYLLARAAGWPMLDGWIGLSLLLYAVVGVFWLPVVWMQARMYRLACAARDSGTLLPPSYFRLYSWWFAFGFPAFGSVLVILWLTLTKPVL